MSNDDTAYVPNANLTDGSERYDKILENFPLDKRENILGNIAIIARMQRKETATAIEVGKALIEIKKVCRGKKGKFDEICDAAEVTRRMIQHLMRIAKHFYDIRDCVCDIPLNLLIRLAAKATPKALIEWVIQEKQAGRSIDLTELKGKLDAVCKNRSPSPAIDESSSEKAAEIAPASTTEVGSCSSLSHTAQVSDESADDGATMSDSTGDPMIADESSECAAGVVMSDERQPHEGQVLQLKGGTRDGARKDESATAAHNAADMLMSEAPIDRHELAVKLKAADALELKKLLIERCNMAEAA
ncbi:hypothetical protein [Methylobacterium sp. J-077]|uniref:hypothetical protein n=1 Tax=Methylobacterium sp. J-077 TaxID=2836656 RepID=UPI001FB8836C|nr:hypothetical protein [Methylobacterium sp. J-077]MCJ2122408.1 hypothetical protein [Methylobacterium sp. J-077]